MSTSVDSKLQSLSMSSNGQKALRYAVLLGSTREGRIGIKAAQYAIKQLQARGHHVDFLDAKEEQLPLLQAPFHAYGLYIQKEAPQQLKTLAEKLNNADGVLVVDTEYNHAPSPGMLNLLDHFYQVCNHLLESVQALRLVSTAERAASSILTSRYNYTTWMTGSVQMESCGHLHLFDAADCRCARCVRAPQRPG